MKKFRIIESLDGITEYIQIQVHSKTSSDLYFQLLRILPMMLKVPDTTKMDSADRGSRRYLLLLLIYDLHKFVQGFNRCAMMNDENSTSENHDYILCKFSAKVIDTQFSYLICIVESRKLISSKYLTGIQKFKDK